MAKTPVEPAKPARKVKPKVYRVDYAVPRRLTVVVGDSRHTLHPVTRTGLREYAPLLVDEPTLAALRESEAGPHITKVTPC